MHTYDPILSGPLNLYNVTLAVLTAVAVGAVILLIVRDAPRRVPLRGWIRRVLAGAGIVLLAVGVLAYVALVFSPGTEDIAAWGVFYLLPAALLAGLAVLAALRPLHAGAVLLAGAALAFLVVLGLGVIAGRIDPAWVADGMDAGSTAATVMFFSVPAAVTGWLLLISGAPVTGAEPTGTEPA